MKRYRVWTRVSPIDEASRFLCVIVAVPELPHHGDARTESESRVIATKALAHETCAEMALAMAERIRQRGDEVAMIESV
jgi:hypothetical protein